jgi:hypothetical protein
MMVQVGGVLLFLFFLAFLAPDDAAAGPLEAARRAAVVDFAGRSLLVGSDAIVAGCVLGFGRVVFKGRWGALGLCFVPFCSGGVIVVGMVSFCRRVVQQAGCIFFFFFSFSLRLFSQLPMF